MLAPRGLFPKSTGTLNTVTLSRADDEDLSLFQRCEHGRDLLPSARLEITQRRAAPLGLVARPFKVASARCVDLARDGETWSLKLPVRWQMEQWRYVPTLRQP